MAKAKIKSYSLSEMKDKLIGKIGTKERDKYEKNFLNKFLNLNECSSKSLSSFKL
ncbi:hypothetical protein J2X17_002472 [Flavobacterium aquidurense]|nr:hypothetical protein [Flavobacterium aquidurense]